RGTSVFMILPIAGETRCSRQHPDVGRIWQVLLGLTQKLAASPFGMLAKRWYRPELRRLSRKPRARSGHLHCPCFGADGYPTQVRMDTKAGHVIDPREGDVRHREPRDGRFVIVGREPFCDNSVGLRPILHPD